MSLSPKIDEIRTFVLELDLDLVCVTETWLWNTISDNSIQIPSYYPLRRDMISDIHGEVCIFVSEQIQYEHLNDYESASQDVLWVNFV